MALFQSTNPTWENNWNKPWDYASRINNLQESDDNTIFQTIKDFAESKSSLSDQSEN